jgi:hypothetical protein
MVREVDARLHFSCPAAGCFHSVSHCAGETGGSKPAHSNRVWLRSNSWWPRSLCLRENAVLVAAEHKARRARWIGVWIRPARAGRPAAASAARGGMAFWTSQIAMPFGCPIPRNPRLNRSCRTPCRHRVPTGWSRSAHPGQK